MSVEWNADPPRDFEHQTPPLSVGVIKTQTAKTVPTQAVDHAAKNRNAQMSSREKIGSVAIQRSRRCKTRYMVDLSFPLAFALP